MERFYKVHEGFDLSGMSDIDYTDTFADIDMEAENLVLFKNWVGECINAGIQLRTDISGGLIIWFDQRNFKKAVSVIPSLPDGFITYPDNYIISAVTKDAILAVLDISPAGDSYSVTVNPGKVFQNATVLHVWMLFAPCCSPRVTRGPCRMAQTAGHCPRKTVKCVCSRGRIRTGH